MKVQMQSERPEFGIKVACALEYEAVMPVRIVAMPAAEPLVDEQRKLQFQGDMGGRFERRILVRPQSVVRPVKHELPMQWWRRVGQHHRSFSKRARKMKIHNLTYLNTPKG